MNQPFPALHLDTGSSGLDRNPAVQMFGRRFFADQTVVEYFAEMLLVTSSTKRIGPGSEIEDVLPSQETLHTWGEGIGLEYAPPARLALKLFSFLGASKLETRHTAHRQHYRTLLKRIENHTVAHHSANVTEVLQILENLFLGFQGVGFDRTWCAQTFLPVCKGVIGAETLWNATKARQIPDGEWSDFLDSFTKYFSVSRHRFLGRGGELLYLQLCNVLRQRQSAFTRVIKPFKDGLMPDETEVSKLYIRTVAALENLLHPLSVPLDDLAGFIDNVDGVTQEKTDYVGGEKRFAACAWVPEESLPESTLFCVEFCRLCEAAIDPVEKVELVATLCALQVLRGLCSQAARYAEWPPEQIAHGSPLGYVWPMSSPEGSDNLTRDLSRRGVVALGRLLHDAIRHPDIDQNVRQASNQAGTPAEGQRSLYEMLYDEADKRYGRKLVVSLAKRINLITPKQGPGARLVLDDRLLRCLLLSLVPPGTRCTLDSFKRRLWIHFGIVTDGPALSEAAEWCGFPPLETGQGDHEGWLVDMLRAGGFLEELSDACSLVQNPFLPKTQGKV